MTRYLLYKVSVRSGDRELATECLESVSASKGNLDFLYACVIDSYHSGDRLCAVESLKMLATSYEHTKPTPVHLPALFRCTIRLLHGLISDESDQTKRDEIVQDLCGMFVGGTVSCLP